MPPSVQQQQDRVAQRHLAILRRAEEITGNVLQTCRYYGISRPRYHIWQRRYAEHGLEGFRDRSGQPHHSPTATHANIVAKIAYLRRNYHFGPQKIGMYLKRYHQTEIEDSTIYRILRRLGLNRLPASQRYQRRNISATGGTRSHYPATASRST